MKFTESNLSIAFATDEPKFYFSAKEPYHLKWQMPGLIPPGLGFQLSLLGGLVEQGSHIMFGLHRHQPIRKTFITHPFMLVI